MHEKEGEEDEVKSIDIVHEDDTYIVFQNGLRLSKPYAFDFIANVKRRWCEVENEEENNIVDIFHKEFPNLPREYYAQAFKDGRLRVEDKNASSVSRSHKKKRKKKTTRKNIFQPWFQDKPFATWCTNTSRRCFVPRTRLKF